MIKKKLFYYKQRHLAVARSLVSYNDLLVASFQKNYEMSSKLRISYLYRTNLKELQGIQFFPFSQTKLRCFYSFQKSVPCKRLQLSRFAITTNSLYAYLSNWTKS